MGCNHARPLLLHLLVNLLSLSLSLYPPCISSPQGPPPPSERPNTTFYFTPYNSSNTTYNFITVVRLVLNGLRGALLLLAEGIQVLQRSLVAQPLGLQ